MQGTPESPPTGPFLDAKLQWGVVEVRCRGVCRDKKWKAVESMDNNKSISLKAVRVYGWKRDKKGGSVENNEQDI